MYYWSSNHQAWFLVKPLRLLTLSETVDKLRAKKIATCRLKSFKLNPFDKHVG